MDKKNRKKTTLTDKELFEYILGSIELVQAYLKNYTLAKFEKDIKIQDAVCYRMHCIGIAASDFSEEMLNKHPDFPWDLYRIWTWDNNSEIIWDLAKAKHRKLEDFDSLRSLFKKLEDIYFLEYFPIRFKSKVEKKINDEVPWSTDYQYPIKTNNSLWTVKKK